MIGKIFTGFILLISTTAMMAESPVNTILDSVPQEQTSKRFTILFTGDTHSHLDNTQKIARSIIIEKSNPENGEVLVADVGDMLTGTEYFEVSNGALEIDMMNLAGYQIATIGNHEFDAGWSNLKTVLDRATFDIVNANIYDIETNALITEPYKVYSIGGLNVALVGIMGQEAWNTIRPSAKPGLILRDPDAVLDELLPQLASSVDAIILLSHSGITTDRQFALRHKQVDVILGGHSHTYMEEPELIQTKDEEKWIPIFHASKNADFLGKFTLEIDNNEKRHYAHLIKMDASKEPQDLLSLEEEQIKNNLLAVSEQIEKIYNRIISTCVVPLPKLGVKTGIVPLGKDFICYILKDTTQADIAVYPSKGIRKGLEVGPITMKIISQLIFDDRLVTYKVRGTYLRNLMEDAEERWISQDEPIQYAGIEMNPTTREITVNESPLQDEDIYLVSSGTYFFEMRLLDSNGNVKEEYKDIVDLQYEEHSLGVRDAFINWLENNDILPYIQRESVMMNNLSHDAEFLGVYHSSYSLSVA